MKSVENKAMLKSMSMLNDKYKVPQKESENFYEYQNHSLALLLSWKLHYIKQETILKRLQEPFEREVGELKYGSLAVVHS